ncbi:hypothetical protein [Rhizobium subbaraonis]|nr:hypothetical protein [Rhizobium subbaraonis]
MFWKSTAVELEMALEGLAGKFGTQPFISREEVRRIAASFGKRRSLKENPAAQVWGESRNQNDPS